MSPRAMPRVGLCCLITILSAALVVAANLLVDFVQALLEQRVRLE